MEKKGEKEHTQRPICLWRETIEWRFGIANSVGFDLIEYDMKSFHIIYSQWARFSCSLIQSVMCFELVYTETLYLCSYYYCRNRISSRFPLVPGFSRIRTVENSFYYQNKCTIWIQVYTHSKWLKTEWKKKRSQQKVTSSHGTITMETLHVEAATTHTHINEHVHCSVCVLFLLLLMFLEL